MPIISLKQDKGIYNPVIWVDRNGSMKVKKYHTNEPIDCYHRLYLSTDDLKLLFRIGKMKKKIRKEDTYEKLEELEKENIKLLEQLDKTFHNPYMLDMEEHDTDVISYLFYDYDYNYHVIKTRDGWYTFCTHSDIWSDGEDCEIDEPSDGPSSVFNEKF